MIIPDSIVRCRGALPHHFNYREQVLQDWVGLAVTDNDLLETGILLDSCESILKSNANNLEITHLILQYKTRGLQALQQALNKPTSSTTIALALALAMNEVI